ncbi:MAG: hypothetical protein ACOCP8_08570 [archaeon]
MFYNNKRGQFLILSFLFLFLLLIISYSIETQNNYIEKNNKYFVVNNIITETCIIGQNSNGSNIQERFLNFTQDVYLYCDDMDYNCNLTIINNTLIPTNISLINYTLFDYYIDFQSNDHLITKKFNC